MSFLRYGLGKFRCCIWKDKFASVYQSTLAWYGQVWCFSDESLKIHGRRNKFRGCPCTRVHQSRMTEQFTRAWMLLGGHVTVPRSRNFSDCSSLVESLRSRATYRSSLGSYHHSAFTTAHLTGFMTPAHWVCMLFHQLVVFSISKIPKKWTKRGTVAF